VPNRRLGLLLSLLALALLALPGAALAQEPVREPAPTPAPALETTVKLGFTGLTNRQVLGGESWAVKGTVGKFVAGQSVTLKIKRNGRRILTRTLAIKQEGSVGRFKLAVKLNRGGLLTIQASHAATPEMAAAESRPLKVRVVSRSARAGDRGLAVKYLQSRLSRLGYVVGKRGYYDARTGRAVLAFRKITRMARTQVATSEVFSRLAKGWGRFKVRYKDHGRHIEGDMTHQVIALISRGKAVRIYPMSSGKPSTPTILGNFSVYMKEPGTNSHGMIFSSYFIRGYAIHGFVDVPVYPASHGCLRIPPPDAVSVYNWINIGTRVDTYYR
jgi:lipoprotein-anchoring transpeptidase ErfK/SrfK